MNHHRLAALAAVVALLLLIPSAASATGSTGTGCKSTTTAGASTYTTTANTCGLALTKTGPAMTHVGDVETYGYTVTSTGNLPVVVDKAAGLTDDKCLAANMKFTGGDTDNDGSVDPGETWAFTCDYTVLAEHVNANSDVVNTATVLGTVTTVFSSSRVARSSTYGCSSGVRARKSTDSCGGCSSSVRAHKSDDEGGCGGCSSSVRAHKSTGTSCGGCSSARARKSTGSCGGGCSSSVARSSTYSSDDDCPVVKTVNLKATAKWTMHVVFPGIDVTKTVDKTTAKLGDTLTYTITVHNTGTVDLNVTVTDPNCGTLSPASTFTPLHVGETQTLHCTHVIAITDPNPSMFHNEACATGTDAAQGSASDCDHTDTPIDPPLPTQVTAPTTAAGGGQIVLGERILPGTARLTGPTGCTSRAFNARIRGTKIARVVFVLDGKTLKRLAKPNLRGAYAVRINPKALRLGVHRLVATVTFQRGSSTKAKKLRLSFQHCARALSAPRFTG